METNNHRRNTRFLSGSLWDFSSHIITYLSQVLSLSLSFSPLYIVCIYIYVCSSFMIAVCPERPPRNALPTGSRLLHGTFCLFLSNFPFSFRLLIYVAKHQTRRNRVDNENLPTDILTLKVYFVYSSAVILSSDFLFIWRLPHSPTQQDWKES